MSKTNCKFLGVNSAIPYSEGFHIYKCKSQNKLDTVDHWMDYFNYLIFIYKKKTN